MQNRETLLYQLDETVTRFLDRLPSKSDPDLLVSESWTAK
jgi:hypothetical protein